MALLNIGASSSPPNPAHRSRHRSISRRQVQIPAISSPRSPARASIVASAPPPLQLKSTSWCSNHRRCLFTVPPSPLPPSLHQSMPGRRRDAEEGQRSVEIGREESVRKMAVMAGRCAAAACVGLGSDGKDAPASICRSGGLGSTAVENEVRPRGEAAMGWMRGRTGTG
ncbi:hypothetical protein M0R45_006662 [Rubus argutus]|uniref:Uncharacterized protein n=1 Tax=Rubus argutus TaxID=59490 RepID=A0AAW1YRW1_RUBAR